MADFDFSDIPSSVLLEIQADLLARMHQDADRLAEITRALASRCAHRIATMSSAKVNGEPSYGSDA